MGRYSGLQLVVCAWLFGCAVASIQVAVNSSSRISGSLIICACMSLWSFYATKSLIPVIAKSTEAKGLFGYDINKKGTEAGEKKIPESLGLAVGLVFLVCMILLQQLHYYDASGFLAYFTNVTPGEVNRQVAADEWLVDYNAALATICFMLFLGFADDVLDIPWRVKLLLPLLASLPLMIAYSGGTSIVLPKPLREMGLPEFLELGILYK
eukprot:scaffold164681_cov34-Prasinocladus_malaysianus.AAC.1